MDPSATEYHMQLSNICAQPNRKATGNNELNAL
jgi:hypothetical protein